MDKALLILTMLAESTPVVLALLVALAGVCLSFFSLWAVVNAYKALYADREIRHRAGDQGRVIEDADSPDQGPGSLGISAGDRGSGITPSAAGSLGTPVTTQRGHLRRRD